MTLFIDFSLPICLYVLFLHRPKKNGTSCRRVYSGSFRIEERSKVMPKSLLVV